MKFLVTADLHVHNHDNRLPVYDTLIGDIIGLALAHKCDGVLVAGDLWDEKHGVNVEVLTFLYNRLKASKDLGMTWTLLRGNHEISMKSEPHVTLLDLFGGVAKVITKPKILANGDGAVACIPWYLQDQFIPIARKVTEKVAKYRGNHIMMAHIGLDEGQLSPSNFYRVPQRVSLQHLFPDSYDLILLGDYHMRQQLAPNVLYLGTPIPQDFADGPTQGVWLLEMSRGRVALTELALMHEYPQFLTHEPSSYADAATIDYTKDNHKLKVPSHLAKDYVGLARANVKVEGVKSEVVSSERVRLKSAQAEVLNHRDIFLDYAQVKKLTPVQRELGARYLARAETELYR